MFGDRKERRLLEVLIDLIQKYQKTIEQLQRENKMAVDQLNNSLSKLESDVQQLIAKQGSSGTPTGATQAEVDTAQARVDALDQHVVAALGTVTPTPTPTPVPTPVPTPTPVV